jgi:transcriptional regulator with XRE-family HTH domain
MTGEELSQLRKTVKLSQRELAEILFVTRVTITRAERDGPSRMIQACVDHAFRTGRVSSSRKEEAS